MRYNLGTNQRPVSSDCFRLLSLVPEIQNDVGVVKPVLGELEVMRLCCSLGMLSSVNPKDFEMEMLEAREFDDDFALFLRKEVFAMDKRDQDDEITVLTLFGKQEGIKQELQQLELWTADMEHGISVEDQGIYCVSRTLATGEPALVIFGWIQDHLFDKSRLRDTATYVLRFLTCLSSDIVCCLSPKDVDQLDKAAASMKTSNLDAWKSFSVAFHVERQEEQKDAVICENVTDVRLQSFQTICDVQMLKGSYPALSVVEPAPATKWTEKKREWFDSITTFAKWLVSYSEERNLKFDFGSQCQTQFHDEILKASGRWPDDELKAIEDTLVQSLLNVQDQTKDQVQTYIEDHRATLLNIIDKLFDLDVLYKGSKEEPAFRTFRDYMEEVQADHTVWSKIDSATKATLSMPLRLKNQMKDIVERFCQYLATESHADESGKKLAVFVRELTVSEKVKIASGGGFFGRLGKAVGELWRGKDLDLIPLQFRECMVHPLEEAREAWFKAVEHVLGVVENAMLTKWSAERQHSYHLTCDEDRSKIVSEAFQELLRTWRAQHDGDLITGICPRVRSHKVVCDIEKEHWNPASDQLKVFKILQNEYEEFTTAVLGTYRLESDATILKVFTIKNHCVMLVTTSTKGTLVERVDFPFGSFCLDSRTGTSAFTRPFGRTAALCDLDVQERTMTFVEESGSVTLYRFNETFSALEIFKRLELTLQTSLTLPATDVLVMDGFLYITDINGMIQSVNTKNQQTSQAVQIRPTESHDYGSSLFSLADNMGLAFVTASTSEISPDKSAKVFAFSIEDFRSIPVSPADPITMAAQGTSAQCFGDKLFVLEPSTSCIHVSRLEVTVRSESFRIRHSNECLVNGNSVEADDANAEEVDHWLRAFYHMYEKFPVCGLIRGIDDTRPTIRLRLACGSTFTEMADDSCRCFFQVITRDLRKLNKPLRGMDLARDLMSVKSWRTDTEKEFLGGKGVATRSLCSFLQELVTFVPIQICRAERNTLTVMSNGQARPTETQAPDMKAVDIARSIRFGLLSPLLESWQGRCVVITSMGKQSTGKSYLLNHLTGSSFAIAGERCTDGAWMTIRVLPRNVLLVVLDFEGLGSFERTEQEDVFLSVLNASVSMFTIFRMEMRYDKEIDQLFARFQKGVALIKGDSSLFRGKLYMSVKDVNPNDQKGVLDEFISKFQTLVGANKENSFLFDLYSGQLDINCSPPLGTIGYYQSLIHAQNFVENSLCADKYMGFQSGKAFLNCIRLVLAKITILDWTSLDEGKRQFQVSEICSQLPGVIRTGCIVPQECVAKEGVIAVYLKEPILSGSTGKVLDVDVEAMCAEYPAMAEKWKRLDATIDFGSLPDWTVDFGFDCCSPCDNNIVRVHNVMRMLLQRYLDMDTSVRGVKVTNEVMADFDSFVAYLIRRRKVRVALWVKQLLGDHVREEWKAIEQQYVGHFQMLLTRCQSNCDKCRLGCLQAAAHTSPMPHDCGGSHVCAGRCEYCERSGHCGKTPPCAREAGHEGRCECVDGDHTCGLECWMSTSPTCGKHCSLKRGHIDLHKCDAPVHICGEPCSAHNCSCQCVLNVENPHAAHKCVELRCMEKCVMDGCNEVCGVADHFHGQTDLLVVFSVENGDGKNSDTFDATCQAPVVHMCGNGHECQAMCDEKGICRVDVFQKQSSKTFTGARGSFQFTFQEMNGSRKKCSKILPPGQQTHQGAHTCISDGDQVNETIHYCDVRCPCCSYFCKKKYGHFGSHSTSHGNMRNTYFLSDAKEIDVEERKYKSGEQGIAEMCNLYCSKMGREHVHYVDCDQNSKVKCVYSGSTTDQRRHCTRALEPKPQNEIDEILHEQFWKTLGWGDPCTSKLELEIFGKCGYKCDAPAHDDKPSYCILPAWHKAESKPSTGFDGFSYVSGHKFECSHVASGCQMHHVFVLDCSGSMSGRPWIDLLAAVREYIYNRISDGGSLDLVSIVTFDNYAQIVYEAQNVTTLTQASIPYRGGGTNYAAGLRAASEVLSRVNFEVYKPAVVFFSDGQPCDPLQGEQLATHVKECYEKYGLLAFAVGFGSVNLSVLERVAQKMGGAYHQVLTGNELKTTFFSILASLSSRAGLALAKPDHERNCVICEQDMASAETMKLKACGHELHTACLELLVRNAEEVSECACCPSCRCEVSS